MKFFYLAPQAAFDSLAGIAEHRAVTVGARSFGFVQFTDEASRQEFLAIPQVIELPHHLSRGTLPATVVTALAAHGITAGDGAVDVAMKIAAKFGGFSLHEFLD
jgi:hypothetical protein